VAKSVELLLLTKPGCHLCDDARDVVGEVRARLAESGIETELEELNILGDVGLARRYSEDIPVVFVNGRRHATWRVDADRLLAAISKAADPRLFHRFSKGSS